MEFAQQRLGLGSRELADRGSGARGSSDLHVVDARGQALDLVDFGGPGGDLESEGRRQCRLGQGASQAHGRGMILGEPDEHLGDDVEACMSLAGNSGHEQS